MNQMYVKIRVKQKKIQIKFWALNITIKIAESQSPQYDNLLL